MTTQNITNACVMVKSDCSTDSTNNLPTPFKLKTCSVTTRPPIRNANSMPMIVITGSMAFFRAWRLTITFSIKPFARAVLT